MLSSIYINIMYVCMYDNNKIKKLRKKTFLFYNNTFNNHTKATAKKNVMLLRLTPTGKYSIYFSCWTIRVYSEKNSM